MDKATKDGIVAKYARKEGDTGSPEVQIAILSQRIHLQQNKKDNSTRRGLLLMVSRRRNLLKYLSRENYERYMSLTTELGIRR